MAETSHLAASRSANARMPGRQNVQDVRWLLITPVYNEEKHIPKMLDSMVAQTVPPTKWVIADDGSTDRTAEIVANYSSRHCFIELISLPKRDKRLPGGESAVAQILRTAEIDSYDFVARFDADLILEAGYIEQILREFLADDRLGIAGGGLYVERNRTLKLEKVPEYHVRGPVKMYRLQCFKDIGGRLGSQIGWDTTDEIYAWCKGWKTRSFFQYRVVHLRPTGGAMPGAVIYWERGKAEYYTWSHPIFALLKTFKVALEASSLIDAASFLAGFVSCYLRREDRLRDPVFQKTRRKQQMQRMLTLGRRPTIV